MSDEPVSLELQEVRGPSVLGGGRRRFFDLLWLLSLNEFRKTYFGSALGYVWSLARPLMLFAVLYVVFTKILRFGSDEIAHYPVLLLFNVVLFGYFQEATGGAVGSVLAQEAIVRKTQFPRLVIPLSPALIALFTLGLNMVAVLVFILAAGITPMWTWLLFPLVLLPLLVLTAGLSMLLAALNVRFRDVGIIWVVVAQALFYASPILYPITTAAIPGTLHDILLINPLTPILTQARHWIIEPSAPGAVAAAGGWLHLLPSIAVFVAVCALGVWVFKREAPKIAELL
ncbi:MAG TPA: ABC transporter permease [Solirubrobacterales bacterium]|nr:ABC transporter permease [Solirubrobacterales bacterium]